jgi:hypothetical protein
MTNNASSSNNFEKELIDLHERMVELEKLEIERQSTGKPSKLCLG